MTDFHPRLHSRWGARLRWRSHLLRLSMLPACALLAAVLFLLPSGTGGLCAQGEARPVTADEVNAIAHRLYCPVCPNERLDSCQTVACGEWRAVIATQLGEGRNEGEIRAYFVDRYGERVLGTPEEPVLHALSVYVPFVLAGVALVLGVFTFTRWRRSSDEAPLPAAPAAPPDDDPYRSLLERDLRK